jgi:23S rRNA (cytosine1962-C5)-methyltransferase
MLISPHWQDYELIDSGDGMKLERFGQYRFVRPEVQCLWRKSLPASEWQNVHAVFQPTGEESGGHWDFKKKVPQDGWTMRYGDLRFRAEATPGRHLGVFPETAAHWDWISNRITISRRPIRVLNLFGYTGIASLAAAHAGASVTHVDASKKSVTWARENQHVSNLDDKTIRWIVDDALKFVQREARRGSQYEGIILDPPKFGRGPKGEVWEIYKSLPILLEACRSVLSDDPLFVVMTVYAVRASALHIGYALAEMTRSFNGTTDQGELITKESSAGHLLSQAVYARWSTQSSS